MRLFIDQEFLDERERVDLIELIKRHGAPTPKLSWPAGQCASAAVYLEQLDDPLGAIVALRIADRLNVDARCGEGLRGVVYQVGEGYRTHHDSFERGSPDYEKEVRAAGNRTLSAMIYLNTVNRGGETRFPGLGLIIAPRAGELVAWNNLTPSWNPNASFIHSAEAPDDQPKYIVTQWFRERPLR